MSNETVESAAPQEEEGKTLGPDGQPITTPEQMHQAVEGAAVRDETTPPWVRREQQGEDNRREDAWRRETGQQ